jgi:hypothetical protein
MLVLKKKKKLHFIFFLFIVAFNNNDQASQELFKEAGYMLGAHLRAISNNIEKKLYEQGKLRVVAVGSVFRSWKFLKPGTQIFHYSSNIFHICRFHGRTFQRKSSAI